MEATDKILFLLVFNVALVPESETVMFQYFLYISTKNFQRIKFQSVDRTLRVDKKEIYT